VAECPGASNLVKKLVLIAILLVIKSKLVRQEAWVYMKLKFLEDTQIKIMEAIHNKTVTQL
jgi:hypothetical protein